MVRSAAHGLNDRMKKIDSIYFKRESELQPVNNNESERGNFWNFYLPISFDVRSLRVLSAL